MLILLLGAFLSRRAAARCNPNVHLQFPAPGPIAPTSLFVIEGNLGAQQEAEGIAKHHPRLASSEESIPLVVRSIHRGQAQVVQAILAPARPLATNSAYRLRVDGLTVEYYGDNRSPICGDGIRSLTWHATERVGRGPAWMAVPKVVGSEYRGFGCGPLVQAIVAIPAHDSAPFLVRAEVTVARGTTEKEQTNQSATYYVAVENGRALLGRKMCGGPFELYEGSTYQVRLTAIGQAGEEAPAPGAPLTVEGIGGHLRAP